MAEPTPPGGANEFARFERSEQSAHVPPADPVADAADPAATEAPFSVRSTHDYSAMPGRASRSFPVAWALVLLPVFLLAGWLVGQMPAKPRSKPATEAPAGELVPVVVNPQPAAPAPAEREPERAGRPARLSSWTTLARAEEESQRTGKPIMIDFNAAWCGPCRMMKDEVFEDSERGDAVRRAVIPVSIVDRSREDGHNSSEVEALLQNWSIEAFPTLIVYKPGTGRSMQTRGFPGADATVEWIERAAHLVR